MFFKLALFLTAAYLLLVASPVSRPHVLHTTPCLVCALVILLPRLVFRSLYAASPLCSSILQ